LQVCADHAWQPDTLVLPVIEQAAPLHTPAASRIQVAEQHTANRRLALVCDHCFRYIGPLELQLGFRLLHCTPPAEVLDPRATALALLDGSMTLPRLLAAQNAPSPVDGSQGEAVEESSAWKVPMLLRQLADNAIGAAEPAGNGGADWRSSAAQQSAIVSHLDEAEVLSLGQDDRAAQSLGDAVQLPDGSPYLFCSHDCAALAWVSWAAVMSPGPQPTSPGIARGSRPDSDEASASTSTANSTLHPGPDDAGHSQVLPSAVLRSPYVQRFQPQSVSVEVHRCCTIAGAVDSFRGLGEAEAAQDGAAVSRDSSYWQRHGRQAALPWVPLSSAARDRARHLRDFYEHADATNDIFRVAARAIATISSFVHLSWYLRHNPGNCQPRQGAGTASADSEVGAELVADVVWAWRPFRAVHSKVWWEYVPMPPDIDDEAAWRRDLECAPAADANRQPSTSKRMSFTGVASARSVVQVISSFCRHAPLTLAACSSSPLAAGALPANHWIASAWPPRASSQRNCLTSVSGGLWLACSSSTTSISAFKARLSFSFWLLMRARRGQL
jgi:hypothetical protein